MKKNITLEFTDRIFNALNKYEKDKEVISDFYVKNKQEAIDLIHFFYSNRWSLDSKLIERVKLALELVPNDKENEWVINEALAIIYKEDAECVVNILRERVKKSSIILDDSLAYEIHLAGAKPFLNMLELEIDNKNVFLLEFGASIYRRIFFKNSELHAFLMDWSRNSKDRERIKLHIILNVLEFQKRDGEFVQEFISMIMDMSIEKNIDFKKETRDIENEVHGAQLVVRKMIDPNRRIGKDKVEKFLKVCPEIKKMLSEKLINQISHTTWHRTSTFEIIYHHSDYWERVFELVNHYSDQPNNHNLSSKISNQKSALVEAELFYHLSNHFPSSVVDLERQDADGGNLDLSVKSDHDSFLLEAVEIEECLKIKINHGGIVSPGSRIYSKVLDKLRVQIKRAANKNPNIPIVLCLHVDSWMEDVFSYENVIHGVLKAVWNFDEKHEVISQHNARGESNIFNAIGAKSLSAIIFYKRKFAQERLNGKLFLNPKAKNKISLKDVEKLKNMIDGE